MEAIDGNDNGIELADAVRYKETSTLLHASAHYGALAFPQVRYKETSTLPHRVHRLNARWNAPKDGPTEDERFETASALCGAEFGEMLRYIVECELPAREIVEIALRARTGVHASGRVICFADGGCPWKTHLYARLRLMATEYH